MAANYKKPIAFQLELPCEYMGDESWVRDDGGPMGQDYRNYADGKVIVVKGLMRDGMHEVALMRLDKTGEITETLLLNLRHEEHEPTQEIADGSQA